MKIVFTGGGTGGHVFPLIAVIRELKSVYLQRGLDNRFQKQESLKLYYLGPRDDFGSILFSQEGVAVKTVLAGKIRRYLTWESVLQNIVDIFLRLPLGFLQSLFHLFFLAPDLIFSKGGNGSLSTVVAGWLLRIPIVLHESDIDPGFSNLFSAKFARKVFVSFPMTEKFPPSKMILVGNPLRKELLTGDKTEAKEALGLTMEKRAIILILGGSQGSQRINEMILAVLPDLLKDFEILHHLGERNFLQTKAEAAVTIPDELKRFYHSFAFLKETELKQAMSAADLIVARAGSGTIFEVAALGKPSILIPLPEAAQRHQLKNAYAFSQKGAAVVLEEDNLTPRFFLEKVKYLFSHPEELEKMSKFAKAFSRPEAAKEIAEYLLDYLKV